MANSEDPDQTAPLRKLRIITVFEFFFFFFISEPLTYKADKLSTKLPHLVIFMMFFLDTANKNDLSLGHIWSKSG